MKTQIKIYNIKEFIRKNVSGEFDFEKSRELVRQIAGLATLHPDHNILMDMRDTTVSSLRITDLMKLSLEFIGYLPEFKNKIVCVVPDNEERLRIARQFHSCMNLKGFSYEIFTDFEKALDYLSDISSAK